jgi:hypothetical protein
MPMLSEMRRVLTGAEGQVADEKRISEEQFSAVSEKPGFSGI